MTCADCGARVTVAMSTADGKLTFCRRCVQWEPAAAPPSPRPRPPCSSTTRSGRPPPPTPLRRSEMLRVLLTILLTLMPLSALPSSGCARGTTVVRVPVPIVVAPPPCVRRPPPRPGESMDAAARAGYYVALTAWAWATWDACKPAGAVP